MESINIHHFADDYNEDQLHSPNDEGCRVTDNLRNSSRVFLNSSLLQKTNIFSHSKENMKQLPYTSLSIKKDNSRN